MRSVTCLVAVTITLALSTGCVGIYSKQDYGPNLMQQAAGFTVGSPISTAITSVGAPDAAYDSDGKRLYVFKRTEGVQVLSLFGQVKKTDLIVITENGLITEVKSVPKGEGIAILAPVLTPVTEIE